MRTAASLLVASLLTGAAIADGEWEIVISTLDKTVPGVPEAVWVPGSFNNPTISAAGLVSFRGQVGGPGITLANSRLILLGEPGNWTVVARDGSPVPGELIKGYVLNQTSGLNGLAASNNLSANGGVLVTGFINGPGVTASTDTATFFVAADGTPSFLIREGDPFPGGGGSTLSSSMSLGSGIRTSDAGAIFIPTNLVGGDVSGSTNNSALLLATPEGVVSIFRKGDPAPGFSDDTTLTPDAFGLNLNGGFVEFPGTLVGSKITLSNDKARFTTLGAAPGSVRMYCREGDPVPGMPGVSYRAGGTFSVPSQPINGDRIVFLADLEGEGIQTGVNDRAIFADQNGSVSMLLRRGDAVPGISPKEAVFGAVNTTSWSTTPNGLLAYQGILQAPDGSSVPDPSYVALRTAEGGVITICRHGDPVPGVPGGTFGSLNGSTSIAVSAAGIVVFQNNIVLGAESVPTLFAYDEAAGLRVIAQAGDTIFTGTPANQLTLIGSTGQNGDGGNTGLNPDGTLVIRAGDTQSQIFAIARIRLGAGAASCAGDFNGDGTVDGADLATLLGGWGACPPKSACPADLNGDGEVNGADLAILLGNWGPCR